MRKIEVRIEIIAVIKLQCLEIVKELFLIVTRYHFKNFVGVSIPLFFLKLTNIHTIVKVIDCYWIRNSAG